MFKFTFTIPDTEKKPKGVTHKVLELVHKLGDIRDPITGKHVVVDRYRDEVKRQFGWKTFRFSFR